MATTEDNQGFLFGALIPGREGAQCAFSVRAISYIFHGWAHYKGRTKLIHGKPDDGVLYAIPFEKLGLFWCRLWRQLWNMNGTQSRLRNRATIETDTGGGVTCPPPFRISSAKHGKRLQRYDGVHTPIPLIEILYQQQELGTRHLFEIRPYMIGETPYPSHYKTEVRAALPVEVRDSLITPFEPCERKLIEEIDEIVRHLGVGEIRALGTHENLKETISDIQWEYAAMRPIVSRIISALEKNEPFADNAQELLEFATEAHRKSRSNQTDYRSAHSRFVNDLRNPLLQRAFESCQASPAEIWNGTQMETLAARSQRVLAISQCLSVVGYFADHPSERSQAQSLRGKEMEHRWRTALNEMRNLNLLNIASDVTTLYESEGSKVTVDVRTRLLNLCTKLEG